jgi:hypothetical protein
MTRELEARLVTLRDELDWPATPPLAGNVGERVRGKAGQRRARWPSRRRILVAALALLLLGTGAAAAASPDARDAVLRFLHLNGAEIVRVRRLPPIAHPHDTLSLGTPIKPTEASRVAGFAPLLPASHGWTAYLHDGELTFRHGGLLVSELHGTTNSDYVYKAIGPGTNLQPVTVRGVRGWWIAGNPHDFAYQSPNGTIRIGTLRLAGNTLLWNEHALLVRIEGAVSLAQAQRTANSLRP